MATLAYILVASKSGVERKICKEVSFLECAREALQTGSQNGERKKRVTETLSF